MKISPMIQASHEPELWLMYGHFDFFILSLQLTYIYLGLSIRNNVVPAAVGVHTPATHFVDAARYRQLLHTSARSDCCRRHPFHAHPSLLSECSTIIIHYIQHPSNNATIINQAKCSYLTTPSWSCKSLHNICCASKACRYTHDPGYNLSYTWSSRLHHHP